MVDISLSLRFVSFTFFICLNSIVGMWKSALRSPQITYRCTGLRYNLIYKPKTSTTSIFHQSLFHPIFLKVKFSEGYLRFVYNTLSCYFFKLIEVIKEQLGLPNYLIYVFDSCFLHIQTLSIWGMRED